MSKRVGMGIKSENTNKESFICASADPEEIATVSVSRPILFADFNFLYLSFLNWPSEPLVKIL